nr:MAG TPA: hypothetical protein [Caudoviricetes sp.]
MHFCKLIDKNNYYETFKRLVYPFLEPIDNPKSKIGLV